MLPVILELYGLEGYETDSIPNGEGRNVAYSCEREGAAARIIRIAFLPGRSREDYLGEVEYVKYLFDHGGSVSNVVESGKGNLLEEIVHDDHTFHVCVFEKARGSKLADNHYRYREGVPITEYYYNCGKTLGKLHQLSKAYAPVHRRYGVLDRYNAEAIERLVPDSLPLLKAKLAELLRALEELGKHRETFGMIHFDYNDGNYAIDYDTGHITVYDFDNACYGWYMYDLADLWRSGLGWIQFEPDADKRRAFMDEYYRTALEGYRSETDLDEATLEQLPLFTRALLMEQVVEYFRHMRSIGEQPECDEELSYCIKCLEDEIPYLGFFHDIYSCEEPFEYEARQI